MTPLIRAKSWTKKQPPRKVLAMRFQALGDVTITLPYLQSLKNRLPTTHLHFLTRDEVSSIPRSLILFDRVFSIRGGRNTALQLLHCMVLLPLLWWKRYDIVLDLQNHKISRLMRKLICPPAWTEFDRTSSLAAGERTRLTIEAAGFSQITVATRFRFISLLTERVEDLLRAHGWDGHSQLVVINPAGNFPSRNWPLQNYLLWAQQWRAQHHDTQFLVMLTQQHFDKAAFLKENLGETCIDLSGKTTQAEAFAIMSKASFMLSEDSGLMHMAWVQGVPTLALFGSTRKDWSAPQGAWSQCLDSSDLECGPCMLEVCKFGDNRCLTRYSPEQVLQRARQLIGKNCLENIS